MSTGSGPYDHPSYITHQIEHLGVTTAGASGTSLAMAPPSALRLRNIAAYVTAAGTSSGAGAKIDVYAGTSSVGTITLGSSTVGSVLTSGDLNTAIAASTPIFFKNGTDATAAARLIAEWHIDPNGGTWSAP